MGINPFMPPPSFEDVPVDAITALKAESITGKRKVTFLGLCDAIKTYVTLHPGADTVELCHGTGASISRIGHATLRMTEKGVLIRTEARTGAVRRYKHYLSETQPVVVKSLRARTRDYVREHPGVERAQVLSDIGRNVASVLCQLIYDQKLRAEIWHTGTHYYVIED